ncbi:40-kDa huntingtin-associated protein [Schistocerca piceifrons]|uniref:40-kDa huntingtin-associated protein n=1 Tax=Schistocerca piceifrons TaxID=274613 RepID=UPI001F5F3522|nr:40-kDa huntingtin-associated protein [Schistocerca piceifrons]XP_049801953.1 40-kDa huntingtin-associated protein [Schistocerca nitens]XP_049852460.1 40-kDa huntingtin-associated protein [Schistocerca gregaria]
MVDSGSGTSDLLAQYRNISNKLKKRFLRKPNVTEASEQFGALALRCEREELPQYAGLCWAAAARCEGSLGNNPAEAWALVRAARQFLSAETKAASLGCTGPGADYLQAAASCYGHAANRWQQHHAAEQPPIPGAAVLPCPLSTGLAVELGLALKNDLRRVAEAATQFKLAAQQTTSPLDRLSCLGHLASCRIELGDYDGALNVFSEMVRVANQGSKPPMGVYSDVLHRCEVTRVLLLLILQPAAQRLPPDLGQVLEKYAWEAGGNVPVNYLSEDEFILLQSLVMACQSKDCESLQELEAQLWPYLTAEQRGLLRTLVCHMTT